MWGKFLYETRKSALACSEAMAGGYIFRRWPYSLC
jgi:hypothetical protein